MDIFVRNAPDAWSEKQFRAFLEPHLAALGVFSCACSKTVGKPFATLTVHNVAAGKQFLAMHGTPSHAPRSARIRVPLTFQGRVLMCTPAKTTPSELILRCVRRSHDLALQRRDRQPDRRKAGGKGHEHTFGFRTLESGMWDHHSGQIVFLSSYRDARVGSLVVGRKSLLIVLFTPASQAAAPASEVVQLRIHYQTVESISVSKSDETIVSITLNQSPVFYRLAQNAEVAVDDSLEARLSRLFIDTSPNRASKTRARVCGISPDHVKVAGLGLVYRLLFHDRAAADSLVRTLRAMDGGPSQPRVHLPVRSVQRDIHRDQVAVLRFLSPPVTVNDDSADTLPFRLRFQLQRLVLNGFMTPGDVLRLAGGMRPLLERHSDMALVEALRRVSRTLPYLQPGANVQHLRVRRFLDVVAEAAAEFVYAGSIYEQADRHTHIALVHKVIVTPCNTFLEGPEPESKNRVLRKYPRHLDYFIRVSFLDEDMQSIAYEPQLNRDDVFRNRFTHVMHQGVDVCGRSYGFLGFSHSSLRTHQCWFMAPFYDADTLLIPTLVIRGLGNFLNIRSPAKCAARIGQAFSDTTDAIPLGPECRVLSLPDIERNGRCFTDGVGTISEALLRKVWSHFTRVRKEHATLLQIRQAGAKGMVSLDTTLAGEQLRLRPSMVKFDGTTDSDLEICGAGYRPLPLFLNQQLIKILEDLGADPHAFLDLQRAAVDELQDVVQHPLGAATFLEQNTTATAAKLPSLIRKLHALGLHFRDDSFLQRAVDVVALTQLRDIKYRARILVTNGYTLLGIADTTGFLLPGQVHVAVKSRQGETSNLVGHVLITRAPALHPGDVQLLEAVHVPASSPLRDLHNCVIFSVHGDRDTPSCLSGGDLDGDLYNVIVEPSLWPSKVHVAADYPRLPAVDIGRPVEVPDITNFFITFMETDQLGYISNTHKQVADQKSDGTRDSSCIKLAELASTAVDYSKTGIAVDISEMPRDFDRRVKPDFMAHAPSLILDSKMVSGPRGLADGQVSLEHEDDDDDAGDDPVDQLQPDRRRQLFYESQKVLGRLYRAVDEDSFLPRLRESDRVRGASQDPAKQASVLDQVWERIQKRCSLVQKDQYRELALKIKNVYESGVNDTMWYYSAHPRQPLTEIEVFTGVILGRAGGIPNRRTRDANQDMKSKYDRELNYIVDWIIRGNASEQHDGDYDLFDANDDDGMTQDQVRRDVQAYERLARSLAVAQVAMEEPGMPVRGLGRLQSFRYVAMSVCLRQMERVFGGDWIRSFT